MNKNFRKYYFKTIFIFVTLCVISTTTSARKWSPNDGTTNMCRALNTDSGTFKTINQWVIDSDYPNKAACDWTVSLATAGSMMAAAGLIVVTGGAAGAMAVATGVGGVVGGIAVNAVLPSAYCACQRNYDLADTKGHGKTTIKLMHNRNDEVDFFVEKAGCAQLKYSGNKPYATVCYDKQNLKKNVVNNYRPSNLITKGLVTIYFAEDGKNSHHCSFHIDNADKNRQYYVYVDSGMRCHLDRFELFGNKKHVERALSQGHTAPDAAIYMDSKNAYFFKNDTYSLYKINHKAVPGKHYPAKTKNAWHGVKGNVDAAVKWKKDVYYLFDGDKYYHYDKKHNKVTKGYPKVTSAHWSRWPKHWKKVDAAIKWSKHTAYFFSGDEYLAYSINHNNVAPGYPKKIKGNWDFPKGWEKGIDAATEWKGGKAYFFKGTQYIKYDRKKFKLEHGLSTINNKSWLGLY